MRFRLGNISSEPNSCLKWLGYIFFIKTQATFRSLNVYLINNSDVSVTKKFVKVCYLIISKILKTDFCKCRLTFLILLQIMITN